jgi:prepilin peptidase CpaA
LDEFAFWLPVGAVGLLTLAAMVWDYRERRIPNALTLPAFVLGLVYQAVFRGMPGLADAGGGFLIGFGALFLLWMIGGGGGGDVKLMGSLSVWLGARLVTQVLVVSVVLVWLATVFCVVFRKKVHDSANPKRHRVMAFAIPAGLATWLIVAVDIVKSQAAG